MIEEVIKWIELAEAELSPIDNQPVTSMHIIDARYALFKAKNEANKISSNPLVMRSVCPKCGNTGRCEPRTLDSPDGQECDCGQTDA